MKNLGNLVFFIGGLIVGAGSGVYYYKTFIADREMEDLRSENDHLREKIRKQKKRNNSKKEDKKPERGQRSRITHPDEIPEDLKEKVDEYVGEDPMEEAVKYGHYYKNEESGEYVPCDNVNDKAAEYTEFHERMRNRPPEMITLGEYLDLGFGEFIEQETLLYYTHDCTMIDEDNEIVDEPAMEHMMGDVLLDYDFEESDKNVIYIINYALDTIYQIVRVKAAYEESDIEKTRCDISMKSNEWWGIERRDK